jgi:hypothetical protein
VKVQDTLKELETVAQKRGVRISYESLGGELGIGGLCKVKGEYRILVDKRAPDGDKINLIAQALGRFSFDDLFMSEQTRALLDRHRKGRPASVKPEEGGG